MYYYFLTLNVSLIDFLEVQQLNPSYSDYKIIKDVVCSYLGITNIDDVGFQSENVINRDVISIKIWSSQNFNNLMFMINKFQAIPERQVSDLSCLLPSYYNFPKNNQQNLIFNFNPPGAVNNNKKDLVKTNKYNTSCPYCGAPAYKGLNDFVCSKGCK